MLDGINPSKNGVLDALGAMRMSGDFSPGHVRRLSRNPQLFKCELRRARSITPRKHSASSANLDEIDAILCVRAHNMPNLVRTVGDLIVAFLRKHGHASLRRVAVEIAMATGD